MDVINRLSPLEIGIDDAPVPLFENLKLRGDRFGRAKERGDEPHRLRFHLVQSGEVFFGDDQHMNGGLRADIFEGHYLVVFEKEGAGDLAVHDFAEETVGLMDWVKTKR